MADRNIKLSIDIVGDNGGAKRLTGWLRDLEKETDRISRETLEYAVRNAKERTKVQEAEARRQAQIDKETLEYAVRNVKERTKQQEAELAKRARLAEAEARRQEKINKESLEYAVRNIKEQTKAKELELKKQAQAAEANLRQQAKIAKQNAVEVAAVQRQAAKEELARAKADLRALNAAEKQHFAAKNAAQKQAANSFLASMKQMEVDSRASATKIRSHFSDAFKGGFFGGLVGSLSAQLAQLPSMLRGTLDEMVAIAAERQNAFKGLESVSLFKGISQTETQDAVKNLRLVKSGIIDVTDATTGLKNLLLTGFSLPEAIKLMETFSDSAAFGKQSALSYGDAIRSATEGLKQGNSILLDNAGITKNLSVILQEHGKAKDDVSKITSDASVRQAVYNGLIQESAAFIGNADTLTQGYTGTIGALETAKKNLYATIGDLITQSPEYIALLKVITAEITGNTSALKENESQTQTTAKGWIASASRMTIAVRNFADAAGAAFKTVYNAALAMGFGTAAQMSVLANAVKGFINDGFITPINMVLATARDNPWLASIFGGAFGASAASSTPIPLLSIDWEQSNKYLKRMEDAVKGISKAWGDAYQSSSQRLDLFNKFVSTPTNNTTPTPNRQNTGGPKMPDTGGGSGGRGGKSVANEMRDFFESAGFTVTRTTGSAINKGSLHPLGLAADVSVRGKNQEQITNLIATAIEHGYRLFDERIPRAGVKQTGPHLHFEKNQRKASGFLGQQFYNAPLGMLQELDQKRLGKGTITSDEVSAFLAKQSDTLTKENREKNLRQLMTAWKMLGLIPDGKLLDEFRSLMVEDAKKAGTLQPTDADVRRGFVRNAAIATTTGASVPNVSISTRLDEQIAAYKERFDIDKRLERLTFERGNHEVVIQTVLQDQIVSRQELEQSLKTELEVLKKSNIVEDARVRALGEKVSLTREVRDLEIELRNQGQNDDLKIQAQLYRDILEIRGRELDAVMRINRAQLELQGAMTVSTKQIKAGIYENLASQKTLNEGIIDGINGTYDAILSRMNEPLDKLNQKSKGLLSFITEPLKAMQANTLSRITKSLVDRFIPDGPLKDALNSTGNPVLDESKKQTSILEQIRDSLGGKSGIPGLGGKKGGSILDTIFGRGSNGPGGTPMFNPDGGAMAGAHGDANAPAGTGGGSMFGGLKSMFAPMKNPMTGKMNSSLAGKLGGIGSILGMAGGLIGGRSGGILSMAGTGMQIGSMFGPWGAAIGAGVGALVGFFTGKKDDAEKKLKEAAASEFGISVKDKAVLKSLKNLGEGMFGKGRIGENAVAVVRSEEGMNILRAYAEGSGQSGLKIDRLNYGDVNWEGNNMRSGFGGFRANGGPVRPGMSYVVGERRPEMFTPTVPGYISPTVPSPTTGMDAKTMQALMKTLDQVTEAVSNLQAVPYAHVVTQGLRENPAAAADAVEYEYENDGRRARTLFRSTGL